MHNELLFLNRDEFSWGEKAIKTNSLNITDADYLAFMDKVNGGFFFGRSLLLYPFLNANEYPCIFYINQILTTLYGPLVKGLISFAQDVFGNQFCFDTANKHVVLFTIEDAGKTIMADSFNGWLDVLASDVDFYTGRPYAAKWLSANHLAINQVICPKIPFVIGGDYKIDNFYAASFPDFLAFYADFAKQISQLPNGTKVSINVKF